jgi:hypothetical protein
MSMPDTNTDQANQGRTRLSGFDRADGPYSPALCLSFLLVIPLLVKFVH